MILLLFALLLAPLFSEVTLLGITLKHQISELKSEVREQLTEIRSTVRVATEAKSNASSNVYLNSPPADAALPDIEAKIKAEVLSALKSAGNIASPPTSLPDVPKDVEFLFSLRYALEKEIRRLGEEADIPSSRPASFTRLVDQLATREALDANLVEAIIALYRVCSPAVHGEPVTSAQTSFAKDVGPPLVVELKSIRRGENGWRRDYQTYSR